MDPLDYFEDALNRDPSLQAVEIEAVLTFNSDGGWKHAWDARTFQEDEHPSYIPNASGPDISTAIEIYLHDLSESFILKSNVKVSLRFERAHPQQDIWRCDCDIKREKGLFASFWDWLKGLFR